jgi:hypothetical protein
MRVIKQVASRLYLQLFKISLLWSCSYIIDTKKGQGGGLTLCYAGAQEVQYKREGGGKKSSEFVLPNNWTAPCRLCLCQYNEMALSLES